MKGVLGLLFIIGCLTTVHLFLGNYAQAKVHASHSPRCHSTLAGKEQPSSAGVEALLKTARVIVNKEIKRQVALHKLLVMRVGSNSLSVFIHAIQTVPNENELIEAILFLGNYGAAEDLVLLDVILDGGMHTYAANSSIENVVDEAATKLIQKYRGSNSKIFTFRHMRTIRQKKRSRR